MRCSAVELKHKRIPRHRESSRDDDDEGIPLRKVESTLSSVQIIEETSTSCTAGNDPVEIKQILIYPPEKGGIPINTADYTCLAEDKFLNDVIIDFYLKYLVRDILSEAQREKTYVFSTFFYKRLTAKPAQMNKILYPHECDSNLSSAQKRHARVKNWTKKVNIFDKDFIIVPINENNHWFVVIICYPNIDGRRSMITGSPIIPKIYQEIEEPGPSTFFGNVTLLNKEEGVTLTGFDYPSQWNIANKSQLDLSPDCYINLEESEGKRMKIESTINSDGYITVRDPVKQPCILIFDSMADDSRSNIAANLRDYLTCEYQAKISINKVFNRHNMRSDAPKIPQQTNYTDCGLYVLQYVEQFFKDPIKDYNLPIQNLENWFDEIVVTRKREEIANLIKDLFYLYNPQAALTLPKLKFPTLNGQPNILCTWNWN